MHSCYRVLPLACNNKIYTGATDFWHQGLGHSSIRFCSTATDIDTDGSILPKCTSQCFCSACAKYNGKHSVFTPVSNAQWKNPLDLIHSEFLGPLTVEFLGRRKYMLTLVENKTRYFAVNFLHKTSDAPRPITGFCAKVNTETQGYPRSLRSDQGGEFVNRDLEVYFKETGITPSKWPPTLTNAMA